MQGPSRDAHRVDEHIVSALRLPDVVISRQQRACFRSVVLQHPARRRGNVVNLIRKRSEERFRVEKRFARGTISRELRRRAARLRRSNQRDEERRAPHLGGARIISLLSFAEAFGFSNSFV